MSRKCAVTDTLFRNFRKSRLQCGHKFTLQLTVNLFPFIILFYITTYICIKKNRIGNSIAVFPKTFNRNINIQSDIVVHYTERNRIRCSIFISHEFFCVYKIYSLIFWCFSAKSKTLADLLKNTFDSLAQITTEKRWFCRHIVSVFSRFCTDIYNFSLFYDQHTLSVVHCDYRSVGYDIF